MPQELWLRGSEDHAVVASSVIDQSGTVVAFPGIASGKYQVGVSYRGGVSRVLRDLEVSAGASTEVLPLELGPVGGASLYLEESDCQRTIPALVLRIENEVAGAESPLEVEDFVCQAEVVGLRAGRYRASLIDVAGKPHSQVAFSVSPGETSRVDLLPGNVWITGDAKLEDGTPVREGKVQIGGETEVIFVDLDERGHFEAEVSKPGLYDLSVRAHKFLGGGEWQQVDLQPGVNEVALRVPGGALDVSVLADGRLGREVEILLLRPEDGSVVSSGFVTAAEAESDVVLLGVPYGRYEVTGSSGRLVAEAPVAVELSKLVPRRKVYVRLVAGGFSIRLVDDQGKPVAGARVFAGHEAYSEKGPGVFVLREAAPGVAVEIYPPDGWTPRCVRLDPSWSKMGDPRDVQMIRATCRLELVLPGDRYLHAYLEGLPGSECPVFADRALRDVHPVDQDQGGGISASFAMTDGRLALHVLPDGPRLELEVPGAPVDLRRELDGGL